MRFRWMFFAAPLALYSLALPVVAYAGIPFLGPIIPDAYNTCAASWGLLITVINNVISFALTIAIVFIAPCTIAYAGFLYVTNAANPTGLGRAKELIKNSLGGIILALASWLIVSAVMAVLYDSNAVGQTWQTLFRSGNIAPCIPLRASLNEVIPGVGMTGIDVGGGQYLSLPTSGDCSASKLLEVTAGSPYPLTQSQANTLSCIAVPESTCSANPPAARQSNGKPTSASGMFQIVFGCEGCNDVCHNLNIPACSQAAGVSGNLNCHSAFRGGQPAPGREAEAAACKRAAANIACNAQAASCLVKARGGKFDDWTGTGDGYGHTTQKNCVTQYAGLR